MNMTRPHACCAGPNGVPAEKSGTGANGYTYFVCNHLGSALSRLPSIKPAQIKAARQIKKFVTGKLDTQVGLQLLLSSHHYWQAWSLATSAAAVLASLLLTHQ